MESYTPQLQTINEETNKVPKSRRSMSCSEEYTMKLSNDNKDKDNKNKKINKKLTNKQVAALNGIDPRTQYIRFRAQQLRLIGMKAPKIRDEFLRLTFHVRQFRQALYNQVIQARELADLHRTVLSTLTRTFKSSIESTFPRSLFRYNQMHTMKFKDMAYEVGKIKSGSHSSLRNPKDIGTLKENLLGTHLMLNDPVLSRYLSVVGSPEEETARNLRYLNEIGRGEDMISEEVEESKKVNITKGAKMTTSLGLVNSDIYNSLKISPSDVYVEELGAVYQNAYKLANDFVLNVSERNSSGTKKGEGKDPMLYHIFSLLHDPKKKTNVYNYWVNHCKDNEERFYEEIIKGKHRFNDELLSEKIFIKPKNNNKINQRKMKDEKNEKSEKKIEKNEKNEENDEQKEEKLKKSTSSTSSSLKKLPPKKNDQIKNNKNPKKNTSHKKKKYNDDNDDEESDGSDRSDRSDEDDDDEDDDYEEEHMSTDEDEEPADILEIEDDNNTLGDFATAISACDEISNKKSFVKPKQPTTTRKRSMSVSGINSESKKHKSSSSSSSSSSSNNKIDSSLFSTSTKTPKKSIPPTINTPVKLSSPTPIPTSSINLAIKRKLFNDDNNSK